VPVAAPRLEQVRVTSQMPAQLEGDPSTWIDDHGVRLAADRARLLASRIDDVESLRLRERDEPATLEEALAGLSRLLDPRR
jgi:hypothetical protein